MITRLRVLLAVVMTAFMLFAMRLTYLQVVLAGELSQKGEENVRVEARVAPLRGRILARDGTVLADNRIASDLMYWGGEIRYWERLKYLLELDAEPEPPSPSDPDQALYGRVLAYNIPDDLVPAVEELVAGQSNLYIRQRVERTYPTNLAAQTIGYTAEAKGRFAGYALSDLVGVMGLEASYQEVLFGTPGKVLSQIDYQGAVLDSEVVEPAVPGQDLVLTLDPKVQRMAEDALQGALEYVNGERALRGLPAESVVKGALVAMDPRNGEILAMASAPTFDQNLFTKRPSDPAQVSALLADTANLPMMNRAVEAYPPASVFKLVSSSTLLENGFVSPTQQYGCPAGITFGGRVWHNWATYYRGAYDVTGAIADSCNTYYWLAVLDTPDARKAGWSPFMQALLERARALGLDRRVGVGLAEEKPGRVPDEAWADANYQYGWLPGMSLNVSIGQGDILTTPVQIAQLTATIAMEGQRVTPHLVKAVGAEEVPLEETIVPGRFWDTLKLGMRKMITDYGSNRILGPASDFPVAVAGKTGTAQNAKGDGYDHVWFTGFAPYDDPSLVWVLFVETGDRSTATGVPTVRDFLSEYYGVNAVEARQP